MLIILHEGSYKYEVPAEFLYLLIIYVTLANNAMESKRVVN